MNLPGFPVAEEEEIWNSVVARHLERSPKPRNRHLRSLRLSVRQASSLIPRDLQHFSSVMPLGHPWKDSPDVIVKRNTLVPLFLHFANPKRVESTLNDIIADGTKNPAASLGLPARAYQTESSATKFCVDCVRDDLKRFGYPVRYRHHQPWFVRVCGKHARPLNFDCCKCHGSKRTGLWQLAGHCQCSEPQLRSHCEKDPNPKTEEVWLWLSRQVATILEISPFPLNINVSANLLRELKASGFVTGNGGLDPNLMAEALRERHGEMALRELGCGSWCKFQGQRPGRVLTRSVIDGRRIPDVLRMLLLTRLVTDNIRTLWNAKDLEPQEKRNRLPVGYGRRSISDRPRLEESSILSALAEADNKITVAARLLGVKAAVLATDMRHFRIRFALPRVTFKRLGATRIAAVRDALAQGVPKTEIETLLQISEWSILLIELDQPNLTEAHRESTIEWQREVHRNTLIRFLRECGSESRSTFVHWHSGSHDWLREYDRPWLLGHLPESVYGCQDGPRRPRKEWAQIDEAASAVIRNVADHELTKSDRPLRITMSRLLSAAGASRAIGQSQDHHYAKSIAEAQRLVETKGQFTCRLIRWALEQYARLHRPISMNQLRRVARLEPREIIEHRDYVSTVAAQLGLTYDARCILAPWRDEAGLAKGADRT